MQQIYTHRHLPHYSHIRPAVAQLTVLDAWQHARQVPLDVTDGRVLNEPGGPPAAVVHQYDRFVLNWVGRSLRFGALDRFRSLPCRVPCTMGQFDTVCQRVSATPGKGFGTPAYVRNFTHKGLSLKTTCVRCHEDDGLPGGHRSVVTAGTNGAPTGFGCHRHARPRTIPHHEAGARR